jgi:N12 class adenine-specific DNA methylase
MVNTKVQDKHTKMIRKIISKFDAPLVDVQLKELYKPVMNCNVVVMWIKSIDVYSNCSINHLLLCLLSIIGVL